MKIVTRGCWLKFRQNATLLAEMEGTEDKEFAECAQDTRSLQKYKNIYSIFVKEYDWWGIRIND